MFPVDFPPENVQNDCIKRQVDIGAESSFSNNPARSTEIKLSDLSKFLSSLNFLYKLFPKRCTIPFCTQ